MSLRKASDGDVLRIAHPDKRRSPFVYSVAAPGGVSSNSSSSSSSSNQQGNIFLYEGIEPGEEPVDEESIKRIEKMELTGVDEYKDDGDDGDDESETAQFWPTYADPTRKDDGKTPKGIPTATPEELEEYRKMLRSEEFRSSYRKLGINKYLESMKKKSGGGRGKDKEEEDYTVALNARSGKCITTRDRLKSIWRSFASFEKTLFEARGGAKPREGLTPFCLVPEKRRCLLYNDEQVRGIMACMEPLALKPDVMKWSEGSVKNLLLLRGAFLSDEYAHTVTFLPGSHLKILVYSNENFNNNVSTVDIFLLYVVLEQKAQKKYEYLFHFYQLIGNNSNE